VYYFQNPPHFFLSFIPSVPHPLYLTLCVATFISADLQTTFHTEFVATSTINVIMTNYFEISFKCMTNRK